MVTVPQQGNADGPRSSRQPKKKMQLFLDQDAHLRLKVANAQGAGTLSQIVSNALRAVLPEVKVEVA